LGRIARKKDPWTPLLTEYRPQVQIGLKNQCSDYPFDHSDNNQIIITYEVIIEVFPIEHHKNV
jgi:hypothetical protein